MEKVIGIGGVFFRARDPQALAEWYREHLGLPIEAGQTYGSLKSQRPGEGTGLVDTAYVGRADQMSMLNDRAGDLDAMLAQLRAAGAAVDDRVEAYENGRFGSAADPEGNRFELWEPRDL